MKVYMKALLFVSSVALTACGGGGSSGGSPSLGGGVLVMLEKFVC